MCKNTRVFDTLVQKYSRNTRVSASVSFVVFSSKLLVWWHSESKIDDLPPKRDPQNDAEMAFKHFGKCIKTG